MKTSVKKKTQAKVDPPHPLDLPDFLVRSRDPEVRKREAAEWDSFLEKGTVRQSLPTSSKSNWLKPKSMSDEDFAAFQAAEEQRKVIKLENRKTKPAKVNTVGKRWDFDKCVWIDEATGAPAQTSQQETRAMKEAVRAVAREAKEKVKAERQIKQAVPATGILAEFLCRPETFRANLLVTFEKNLGKMVSSAALAKAVYDDASSTSKLAMVIKGARDSIVKLKLPYELRDKDKAAWGLFKATKGKGK